MEQWNIPKNETQEIFIIALDLSNIFYLINATTGELVLINDSASKMSASQGTYCEILRSLDSTSRDFFVSARWNGNTNHIEVRRTQDLSEVVSIPVS